MQTKTIEYKIACEVHILHDYYLIDSNYQSFFARSDADKQRLLDTKLGRRQYDISRDFNFLINGEASMMIKDYRLRILPSPLGFMLAMEVRSVHQADGSTRYRPVISIPEDIVLSLGIRIANPLFGNFTSIALQSVNDNIYTFTNDGPHHANALSRPIPAFAAGQFYRMGDLARFGSIIRQATEDNNGDTLKWEAVAGNGFVNEADRILEIKSSHYRDWRLAFPVPVPRPFGMIQLRFHTENPNFTLITPDGYLATQRSAGARRASAPRFELRFLSRFAYWRYRNKDGFTPAEIIRINDDTGGLLGQTGEILVTRKPRYFAQTLTTFVAGLRPFPNASPSSLRAESRRLYSDVHFNAIHPVP